MTLAHRIGDKCNVYYIDNVYPIMLSSKHVYSLI